MIAGGNTAVFCPHPNARRVSNLTIDLMNRAARRAGAPHPLLHSVEQPTLEVAQALLRFKGIRLNVVTGGPGVVREALDAGKKAITAIFAIPDPAQHMPNSHTTAPTPSRIA